MGIRRNAMHGVTVALLSLVALFFAADTFSQTQRQPAADLIITNAKVWTVDKTIPTAQAIAVLGERIVAVGSNAEVDTWRGAQTSVVDAGGKLLLPGFNDAHVHFISGGSQLDNVQLNDATAPKNLRAASPSTHGRFPRASGFSAAIGMRPNGLPPICRRTKLSMRSRRTIRFL